MLAGASIAETLAGDSWLRFHWLRTLGALHGDKTFFTTEESLGFMHDAHDIASSKFGKDHYKHASF